MARLHKLALSLEVPLMLLASMAAAVSPSEDEMLEARRWAAARFEGVAEAPLPDARLVVRANNDPVQKNVRIGRPLRTAGEVYHQGLFCHAVSEVVVRLPGPGRVLRAVAGLDSNEQTRPGRGTVVFSVEVGGEERFRSPVLQEGMAGIPLEVPLAGASEFLLKVGDAGDGISCDQADWAQARVELLDGSVVWLADLAMEHPHRAVYPTELPFSFVCGGRPSSEFLAAWQFTREARDLDGQRREFTLTWRDPAGGLSLRCVAVEYRDFPVVEWTLYLKNEGEQDTPLIEDLQALDAVWQRYAWPPMENVEFLLHHHAGSPCLPTDYQPMATQLRPEQRLRFAPRAGRPSDPDLPCFSLEWPGEGVIVAVGWPGQWAASFERDGGTGLRVRAGQELLRLALHPGEEVRTPLIALLFWKGDQVRAQNLWRRWMLAHNLPRPLGPQMAACSSHQYGEMIHANRDNQIMFVDRYLEEGLPLDYWWMDADWYVNRHGWPHTGTWEVDTERFPGGLRAITDHAHAKGVRSIVWFEPERVTPDTWLYDTHPEWLLGEDGQQKLLNLGNPEARQWLTEHVDRLINEQGIDLYRNDFNIDPLSYWRANEAEDRQGLTENLYVQGFLAYWDELRRRHPGMLIDTCASGGRRNDLETLRRSVPLLRSDYIIEPVSQQNHTYGIASWIPFYGTGINAFDAYTFRSQQCPQLIACYDMRNREQDFEALRRLLGQWREAAPCYFGDYYPLSPYNPRHDVWMAWQFDLPEKGEGIVQVFQREDAIYEAARLRLRGLDPEMTYLVTDLDRPEAEQRFSGRELLQRGLPVAIEEQPGAVVFRYRLSPPL